RVRRVEIGRLFSRLSQPVRELARREQKEVTLAFSGEETEIDKALVERIAEPLLHLLRNAVAHGVEPPEVRAALGKPRAGTVTLTARQAGDAVEIVVADDGQGIDLAGVRGALVAAGRVDGEAAASLDEASLFAALFEPGVSTRVAADDVAGRGVGLDAVRDALQHLRGTVTLPLVRLGALLGVPPPPGATRRRAALVINTGEFVFAATCDKVIGPREIVVRSLGPMFADLPLYAGATISGAGKVQLIL